MKISIINPLFTLGMVVATPGAIEAMAELYRGNACPGIYLATGVIAAMKIRLQTTQR